MGKKFDEFYFLKDEVILEKQVLDKYAKENNSLGDYSNNQMLCPECKNAVLKYTFPTIVNNNGNIYDRKSFLSAVDVKQHLDDCDYKYETLTKKQEKEYIQNLDESQIQVKLDSVLRKMLRDQEPNTPDGKPQSKESNPFIFEESNDSKSHTGVRKSIRRKSVNSYIDKDEYDGQLVIIYGKVRLEVQTQINENNNNEYYNLVVKTEKDGIYNQRHEIYRGKQRDNVDVNADYNFAIMCRIVFSEKGYPKLTPLIGNKCKVSYEIVIP